MSYIEEQYRVSVNYIKDCSIYWFSFITSLATFWLSILFGYSYRFLTDYERSSDTSRYIYNSWEDIGIQLLRSLVISPLWETFAFQFTLLFILIKTNINNMTAILLSGIAFSLIHLSNSTSNAVTIFPLGCLLAATFVFWFNKTASYKKAFEATLAVHIFHNLYWISIYIISSSFIIHRF